jgi:hypothetical protein
MRARHPASLPLDERSGSVQPWLSTPRGIALLTVAVAAASGGVVFLLYAAGIHAAIGISDGASVALEGQAMGNGHVLLHGWALSYDSFWTLDAPFYALASVIVGIRPSLLFAVPAIIATVVIVVGAIMAREGRRGAAGIAASLTVVALLAFPTHAFASFFVRGPFHVATALFSLLAFAGLRRPRLGWGWVVSVVLLTLGMLGDLQILFYGVVPIFLAGIAIMMRERTFRNGIITSSAAIASLPLTVVVRKILKSFGAFTIGPGNPLASFHQILINMIHAVAYSFELIGVGSSHLGTGGVPGSLQAIHVVPALLMSGCLLLELVFLFRGVVRILRRRNPLPAPLPPAGTPGSESAESEVPLSTTRYSRLRMTGSSEDDDESWRLDYMLLIATAGSGASFVFLAVSNDFEYSRYLVTGVIFAAILSGRLVGRYWSQLASLEISRLVTALGIVVTVLIVACVGYTLAQPIPVQPAAKLGSWLHANHLTAGVGDYWSSSIVTVETESQVKVRPVVIGDRGILVRFMRESASSWYEKQTFQFFVYNVAMPWGSDNATTATKTWGVPAHTFIVGTYRVLTWSAPIVVQEP